MNKPYTHKVQYYETDKMGLTHHSNYLRFMEEARVDFLERVGFGYRRLEEEGLISPVVAVNVDYKKPTTFDDEIAIEVRVRECSPVKLTIAYTMTCRGETVCNATSVHCFVDKNGHPMSLKRAKPEFFQLLCSLAEKA